MNKIITENQAKIERFSAANFNVHSREEYMAFYMLVLKNAGDQGLIDEKQIEVVNSCLLAAILEFSDNQAVIASNLLYALSFWLQSIGPVDALKELMTITSTASATVFVGKVVQYVKAFAQKQATILFSCERTAIQLENTAILESFESLKNAVAELGDFYSSEDVNLQEYHGKSLVGMRYELSLEIHESESYFKVLEDTIYSFVMEIRIMKKVNGSSYLQTIAAKQQKAEDERVKTSENISKRYEDKISQLNNERDQKVKKLLEKLTPGADEVMYDDIYSEVDSIKTHYSELIEKAQEEWSAEEDAYWENVRNYGEIEGRTENFMEDVFLMQAETPSLNGLIKSLAFYSKVQSGEILLDSFDQKTVAVAIDKIKLADAIDEILKYKVAMNFTEGEAQYLMNKRV